MTDDSRVLVLTGAGGMGVAIARRIGSGAIVVLADVNPASLSAAADSLRADGHHVVAQATDGRIRLP